MCPVIKHLQVNLCSKHHHIVQLCRGHATDSRMGYGGGDDDVIRITGLIRAVADGLDHGPIGRVSAEIGCSRRRGGKIGVVATGVSSERNIRVLLWKFRRVFVTDGRAVGFNQRQIVTISSQVEIGMQLPADEIIGAARTEYEFVGVAIERRTGKTPFFQIVRVIGQVPTIEIGGPAA